MSAKPRIAVLGGGFGGLESLFYLRYMLGTRAELTLVTDQPRFVFKPNTIYIPFGQPPEKYEIDIDHALQKQGIARVLGTVSAIDPERREVTTSAGVVGYDYVVIATGAKMRAEEVPGLSEHAVTVWTPDDMLRLRERIAWAKQRAGENVRTRFVFLVPPNNRCSGPLYELVCMLDTHLKQTGGRAQIDLEFATKESAFIEAFGPRLNSVVTEEVRERGITGHTNFVTTHVEPGRVAFENGQQLAYDVLVSFPPYVAGTSFASLPRDEREFLKVDADSRRLTGLEREFAAGDVANFPIKQAFLALLQADAAADHIAAEVLGKQPTVDFHPLSMCVMEQFDKAVFAQVPLKYTDDTAKPVTVDVDDAEHYKVGVSPLWRLGKSVLGYYLPWRFESGKPFHAGFGWDVMDLGLKAMSKVLAK